MAKRTVRREPQPRSSDTMTQTHQATSDDRTRVGVMEKEPTQEMREPDYDSIARRAYELYCERGCEPGREMDDWLKAEQELRNIG